MLRSGLVLLALLPQTVVAERYLLTGDLQVHGCPSQEHLSNLLVQTSQRPLPDAVGTLLTGSGCELFGPFPQDILIASLIDSNSLDPGSGYDRLDWVSWQFEGSTDIYHSAIARGSLSGVWFNMADAIIEVRMIEGALDMLSGN